MKSGGGNRHWGLVLVLLLCALPGLTYIRGGPLLEYDVDTPLILQRIDAHGGLAGSWHWFVSDWPLATHLYRPVTVLSFAVDRVLWGNQADGYRFTAWLLTIAANILLAWLMLRICGSELAAALACLLLSSELWGYDPDFIGSIERIAPLLCAGAVLLAVLSTLQRRAGHAREAALLRAPLLIGSALLASLYLERTTLYTLSSWIAARTSHLGALFGAVTLLLLLDYTRTERRRSLLLAFLACALALASYEQMVVLPAIATVWLLLLHRRGSKAALRAALGFWILLAGYILLRQVIFGLTPSSYHRMQVHLNWGAAEDWLGYLLPPLQDFDVWQCLPTEGIYALWSPQFWLCLISLPAYGLVLSLLWSQRRTALLFFSWKAIAFAPMAFLPPYPHYFYFSEMGSCLLGALL
ncbi:MAG TPA: hypothetical protein VHR86_10430, partial [Armatimonadota bacterium]|nr:hypothetical protein [Armatimonadota bacterium]